MTLKTLKDIKGDYCPQCKLWSDAISPPDLRQEAIKIFKNLQGAESIYPLILDNFPESSKGQIAKDKWSNNEFRYGAEYSMLSMLFWFLG